MTFRSQPLRQRGVALITALLVVSLASIAAVAVASAGFQALSRTQLLLDTERAIWYAQGMEAWAVSILAREGAETEIDHLGEVWARRLPPLPVEGGALQGEINDAQGRFNLNNLGATDPDELARRIEQFLRLVECTQAAEDSFGTRDIANAIVDWIDADDEQRFPGGGEDLLYLGKAPPYRAANQPMTEASELRAVEGVTAAIYRALRPHVIALPEATTINLNTATPEVLCSLSDNTDYRSRITEFVERRLEAPLENVTEAFAEGSLFPPGDIGVTQSDLSVRSSYFTTRAEAFIGNGSAVLYSLVARPDQGVPLVLRRSTASE